MEAEHEGEGTEGRRWRRRGEERRERRGMTRLGEGRGLRGGRGFLKNYDDFFKYRPHSEFFLLHVIIKYNLGFHTKNIRTCLLFLVDKLDYGLVPRKPEGFFQKTYKDRCRPTNEPPRLGSLWCLQSGGTFNNSRWEEYCHIYLFL